MTSTLPRPDLVAPRALPPIAADRRRRRRAAASNAVAIAVIWGTSLAVVALWVAGSGLQTLFAFNWDSLTTLGRLTGLVSANLLLYQVLLMARVPILERGLGRDAIVRFHRLAGFWSFTLLIAHIALVTLGYAGSGGWGPLDQLWDFVWNYPGMLLATLGTVALVGFVVLMSLRAVRRRLRYETWHLLHLYGYVGVFLALPHQLWTGADFLASPLATGYWWGLWGVTAGAVLVWRVGVPLLRSARHRIRVRAVESDGSSGVTVTMTGRQLERLRAEAGQYFVWRFLDGPGWMRGHPFSLSAAPDGSVLQISAKIVGDGTERLRRLRPGTRVLIEGPYGDMTGAARHGGALLMLGAGAGVAPLVALLEGERYRDAVLVTRDTRPEDAMLLSRIGALIRDRGVRAFSLHGPRSRAGASWLPEQYGQWRGGDMLRHLQPSIGDADVYLCGPAKWMEAIRADLDELGVARNRIHAEAFGLD